MTTTERPARAGFLRVTRSRGLLSGRMTAQTTFPEDDVRLQDPKFQQPRFRQYVAAVDEFVSARKALLRPQ